MSPVHHGYDDLRADTGRRVAKSMADAAITAPTSGGQLFPAGTHNFPLALGCDRAVIPRRPPNSPRSARSGGRAPSMR